MLRCEYRGSAVRQAPGPSFHIPASLPWSPASGWQPPWGLASLPFSCLRGLSSSAGTALMPSPPTPPHTPRVQQTWGKMCPPAYSWAKPGFQPQAAPGPLAGGSGHQVLLIRSLQALFFPKRSSQTPAVLGCPQLPKIGLSGLLPPLSPARPDPCHSCHRDPARKLPRASSHSCSQASVSMLLASVHIY